MLSHEPRTLDARARKALGIVHFPRGDYASAIIYFQKFVDLSPPDLETRFFLGTCLRKLRDPCGAAEQFHVAWEADATCYEADEAETKALEAAGDKAQVAHVRSLVPKH